VSPRLYAIHRIVSAVALVQLFVWTVSGLAFAILPGDSVRGALVERAHEAPIPGASGVAPLAEALRAAGESGLSSVVKIELRATPSGLFYVARGEGGAVRLDARTAAPAPVTIEEAEETARRDQPGRPPVAASERLEKSADVEYRTRPLPAYRVELGDELGTVVYIDARSGDVTARRTNAWRLFDFMYSLHIMDYKDRDDRNQPLLIGAGVLALGTVASGAALWVVRIARRLRRLRRGRRGRDES
jgi:uncharacterized iron-regulated membrane protein